MHRFRIERWLGRGGCGEVHAAFDLLAERRVALKLLRTDSASEPDLEESLRGEFRALRGLSHPGIVQVFDLGRTEEGAPFFTMELLGGTDLAQAPRPLDAHACFEQVARALDYLHANGLVHSDLKPSNVFVAGTPPRFTLTDFGLAGRMRGARRDSPYGTIAYMPPERLRATSAGPDAREDLYALGAIVFELLTGRPPFTAATPDATLANVLHGDLEAELTAVPDTWARVLRKLLAREPERRFATAWEALQSWSAQFDRPAPIPQLWSAPFVGRRRELAAIRTALADVHRGRGVLFHVTGQPGFGKSALLEMAMAQAAAAGLPVWRIEPPAAPRPFALVESLARLYARWQPALPAEVAPAASRLAAWPATLHQAHSAEEQLNANARALADLRQVADAMPHVLVVDDAHRLDLASCGVLTFVGRNARESGVVTLAASRSGAGTGDAAALQDDLLLARASGAAIQWMPLRTLAADEVAALVRRRFDASPAFELLAQRVYELTEGHPFFVSQTLQHLILSGQVRRQSGTWQMQPQAERRLLPHMADNILSEHLAAMRPEDRVAFEVLALFPAGAMATALAAVCERPADEVAMAIERGVRGGLLIAEHTGQARFAHELIREACAAQCEPDTSRRLHRAIADSVAGSAAEAYHRLAGEEASPASRACFLREAERFEARRALVEALRYAEAALAVAAHVPGDEHDLPLRVATLRARTGRHQAAAALLLGHIDRTEGLLRARYLHCLAYAYWLQGQRDLSLQHLRQAAELFQAHGDFEARSLVDGYSPFIVDLIEVLLTSGDTASAIAECDRALRAMPIETPLAHRATLLLLEARAQRSAGAYDTAEASCRAAIEVLKPLGRGLELGKAYNELGNCSYYRRDFDEAERFYRMALKVHSELGDLRGMANNSNNLGMALMRAERLEDAIVAYEQSLALKRRLGDRAGEGNSLNNLGNLWLRRHQPRRAFECFRRGISLYRRLGRPRELATLYNNMGEESIVLGRLHRARRALERARDLADGRAAYISQAIAINLGYLQVLLLEPRAAVATLSAVSEGQSTVPANLAARIHALLCLAHARAGDAPAATEAEQSATNALSPELEAEARLDALGHLAEAALALGRFEDAAARAREALGLATHGDRPHASVRARRILAQVAHYQGDWDHAEALLTAALEQCEAYGFRHERAQCYKSCGTLHWDIGLRARALDDFQRCIETLLGLGLRHELGLVYLELARRVPEDGCA